MSSMIQASIAGSPRTRRRSVVETGGSRLTEKLIVAFATAADVRTGMRDVVSHLHAHAGARRVEWWAPTADTASLRLEASAGDGRGERTALPVGAGASIVFTDAELSPSLRTAVAALAAPVGRRRSEEQLALAATDLLRRYDALDEFATLIAHELKAALSTSLAADACSVERLLQLVDAVFEVARVDSRASASTDVRECIADVQRDLGSGLTIESTLPKQLPIAAPTLRLVLRNLLSNAVAARASRVRLTAVAAPESWTVRVDDDGVGLNSEGYASGCRIGFSLCRGIVERTGGQLELGPAPGGGARATLVLSRGVRP